MTMRNLKRILSLVLGAAMIMSLLLMPSMAASSNWVTATLDGNKVYHESYPDGVAVNEAKLVDDLGVGVDVKVTVNDSSSSTARPINMSGTLANGTVYRLFENGDRSLSLTTTNKQIKDDISIDIVRTPRTYTITANSGPKGFKDDFGSDSNPTCAVSAANTTVDGNSTWEGSFTPNDGLIIKALNIRTSASGHNLVDADTDSVTVGNTKLTITHSGNEVKVKADQVADNLFITALTAERTAQYRLSVVTVGDVASDVASILMDAGSTKDVVLTPGTDSIIDTIEISDGGKTGTLTASATSISVNGHTYKASHGQDGKTTVYVPAISADVKITATASANKASLTIDFPSNVDCDKPAKSFIEKDSYVEVCLTPDDDSKITSIKIRSATDSVTLNDNEYRFVLDGRIYRVDTRYDSSRTLFFDSFPGNIQITVESREFRHAVKLDTDKGCDYEGHTDKLVVDDGDSCTFSFIPFAGYEIKRLVFTVSGKSVEVWEEDSYVTINGVRCPITWSDGRVTVTLYDVEKDISVKARTNTYDEDYVIRIDCDGGVTTPNSRIYANHGNSRTVTFTNRNGYRAQRIDVEAKGKVYSASRNDSYITIDGRRCSLTWTSAKVTINLSNIRCDMNIYCDSDFEGTNDYRPIDGDHVITLLSDNGATYSGSGRIGVDSGDSKTVAFEVEKNWRLLRLVVTYNGKTHRINCGDSSVYIDGCRYSADWNGATEVSLTLRNIRGDVTVEAETNYSGPSGSYSIDRRAGVGTQIALDPDSTSVRPNKSITVTVIPGRGYEIDSVEFKLGSTKAVSVASGARSFKLNGKTYSIEWTDNGAMKVRFDKLTGNLIVTSTARQNIYHASYVAGVGDSRFQPDRAVTRAEALTMLTRAFLNGGKMDMGGAMTVPYLDVQVNAWYYAFVNHAFNKGYLTGLHDVSFYAFRPNDSITRAEFVEMAERFMEVGDKGYTHTKYSDVPIDHWASGAIAYATSQGWITGYPNGAFGPDDTLTRAQLVTMINNILGRIPNKGAIESGMSELIIFTDVSPVHWAYYHILEAANDHHCVINGGVEVWGRR